MDEAPKYKKPTPDQAQTRGRLYSRSCAEKITGETENMVKIKAGSKVMD